jgi:hypothetical protein
MRWITLGPANHLGRSLLHPAGRRRRHHR